MNAPASIAPDAPAFEAFDVAVEQALLGAFFVDQKTIAIAASQCQPADFYDPMHKRLAARIFEMDEAGRIITPLTVGAAMKADPGLIECGGLGYLAGLAMAAPALPPVASYAQILSELRLRRDTEAAVFDTSEALARGDSLDAATAPMIRATELIAEREQARHGSGHAGGAAHALMRQIQEQATAEKPFGVSSGLAPLDAIVGGFYPGNLTFIGGRPGMGKSILATNLCRVAAQAGIPAMYFSLEMGRREVAARLLADMDFDRAYEDARKTLSYSELIQLRADQVALTRAAEANIALEKLNIEIIDREKLNIHQISALARARVHAAGTAHMVVIDHLQIIAASATRRDARRLDDLTEITSVAKQMSRALKSPVVVLSQLNREVERRDNKRPVLADFRESGSIEQDADVMLGLYRPTYYARAALKAAHDEDQRTKALAEMEAAQGVLEIGVLKNRNGPTDDVTVFIDEKASAIRDEKPVRGQQTEGLGF